MVVVEEYCFVNFESNNFMEAISLTSVSGKFGAAHCLQDFLHAVSIYRGLIMHSPAKAQAGQYGSVSAQFGAAETPLCWPVHCLASPGWSVVPFLGSLALMTLLNSVQHNKNCVIIALTNCCYSDGSLLLDNWWFQISLK